MHTRKLLACAGFALLAQGALAADASVTGQRYAATCANCHGTNGVARGGAVASLAGLPQDYIVKAMKDFQQGKREATVMHQLAKGYSDEQIEQIAAYFAAQKK